MMMMSTLLGQYVVDNNFDGPLYYKIVLVHVDRGELKMVARNMEDRLVTFDVEFTQVLPEPPMWRNLKRCQEEIEEAKSKGLEYSEARLERAKILDECDLRISK